jgi:predicted ATPase
VTATTTDGAYAAAQNSGDRAAPEFEPSWIGLANVSTLTLGRLDHNAVERMIAQLTPGRVLPAEVMKQNVAKTDGNPLFVEELTKGASKPIGSDLPLDYGRGRTVAPPPTRGE